MLGCVYLQPVCVGHVEALGPHPVCTSITSPNLFLRLHFLLCVSTLLSCLYEDRLRAGCRRGYTRTSNLLELGSPEAAQATCPGGDYVSAGNGIWVSVKTARSLNC